MKTLTQSIKSKALALGFDDIGVASAIEGTPYGKEFLEAIDEGRLDPLDYMQRTAAERSDIQKLMPGAKSVVIVVKNYFIGDHSDFVDEKTLSTGAKVSRYAWGGDYHHWFKKRLRQMRLFLHESSPLARIHIFNDTGPVLERGWAERSGLGFIGKSGMFIHRQFGTWTFLGGFVTDIELVPDAPTVKQLCGSCTACMDACPTKAIISPRKIDSRRCLTTWNIERPMALQADAEFLQGKGWAVGCDICQQVCPWNKFEQKTFEPRFAPRSDHMVLHSNAIPKNITGTPLARPKEEGLLLSIRRALAKSEIPNSDHGAGGQE